MDGLGNNFHRFVRSLEIRTIQFSSRQNIRCSLFLVLSLCSQDRVVEVGLADGLYLGKLTVFVNYLVSHPTRRWRWRRCCLWTSLISSSRSNLPHISTKAVGQLWQECEWSLAVVIDWAVWMFSYLVFWCNLVKSDIQKKYFVFVASLKFGASVCTSWGPRRRWSPLWCMRED